MNSNKHVAMRNAEVRRVRALSRKLAADPPAWLAVAVISIILAVAAASLLVWQDRHNGRPAKEQFSLYTGDALSPTMPRPGESHPAKKLKKARDS